MTRAEFTHRALVGQVVECVWRRFLTDVRTEHVALALESGMVVSRVCRACTPRAQVACGVIRVVDARYLSSQMFLVRMIIGDGQVLFETQLPTLTWRECEITEEESWSRL